MYVTLTSLVCFTNVYHLKRIICLEKGVPEGKMAAARATGEKLPMFVVGKSKTPRCFENIKQLPSRYRSQKKTWMNGDFFGEWLRKLDSQLIR